MHSFLSFMSLLFSTTLIDIYILPYFNIDLYLVGGGERLGDIFL